MVSCLWIFHRSMIFATAGSPIAPGSMEQSLLCRFQFNVMARPYLQSRLLDGPGKLKCQRPRQSRLESDIHGIQTGRGQFTGLAARQERNPRNGSGNGSQETDKLTQPRRGHNQFPIGTAGFFSLRNSCFFKTLVTGGGTLIHGQKTFVLSDHSFGCGYKLLRTHLRCLLRFFYFSKVATFARRRLNRSDPLKLTYRNVWTKSQDRACPVTRPPPGT